MRMEGALFMIQSIQSNKTCLGIELGSTRIKAVTIGEDHTLMSSGIYTWASSYENGVWTYSLDEAWSGLKAALSGVENRENICAIGVSVMMHGYLAFDADWNLLVPFRTWQNTITGPAEAEGVAIDSLTGHGRLFKTPGVGQKYMAAACNAPSPAWTPLGRAGLW